MQANDALYASSEFVGYSLWLVPNETVEKDLSDVIKSLAARLTTPVFRPHATLLGGVVGMEERQAMERTKRVAERLGEIDTEIEVISSKDLLYFQCVFGLLPLSQELQDAHRCATEVFERENEPTFMPHVSLVYGDLPSPDRQALAHELMPQLHGLHMKMEKLQLWNTTGPVKNWSLVAEFLLTSEKLHTPNILK